MARIRMLADQLLVELMPDGWVPGGRKHGVIELSEEARRKLKQYEVTYARVLAIGPGEPMKYHVVMETMNEAYDRDKARGADTRHTQPLPKAVITLRRAMEVDDYAIVAIKPMCGSKVELNGNEYLIISEQRDVLGIIIDEPSGTGNGEQAPGEGRRVGVVSDPDVGEQS